MKKRVHGDLFVIGDLFAIGDLFVIASPAFLAKPLVQRVVQDPECVSEGLPGVAICFEARREILILL